MTADPRTSWGTATATRPEPLPDRRYPRCGRCERGCVWHGLPCMTLGCGCPTSFEEGVMKCKTWGGEPRNYQNEAQIAWANHHDRTPLPWSWITTPDCDSDLCLNPECMVIHAPIKILYPRGVCVYCGDPAGTKDHLLPKPLTGLALRHLVAVVPACANCNSRIGDEPGVSVSERRRRAQRSIERSAKRTLAMDLSDEALAEMGRTLRAGAERYRQQRWHALARLSWPDDPFYDIRAFQQSGIEDPVATGMCDALAVGLRSNSELGGESIEDVDGAQIGREGVA